MRVFDPITPALEEIYRRHVNDTRGELADYIPQLATVELDQFGIAIASVEGKIYGAGDDEAPFTIQSVSKPFVYALALADHGLDAMLERVGAEPTGEAFNAASLEPEIGRPLNPMINAGAILTTSLVAAADPRERFERIHDALSAFAGRTLDVDEAVYRSERETGDRNQSLGYLMRGAGSLSASVDQTVDVYFRQCAVLVTVRDLAVMAATLANGGVNPLTGTAVISVQVASHVLTVMGTCGMYDYSGEWLLRVGLPAKSGVSGAVLAAKPAQFGIGLFSPLLDARGNSVRAIATCRELADRFELQLLNHPGKPAPPTYLRATGSTVHSAFSRSEAQRAALLAHGTAIAIRGLQGEMDFAAAEQLLHDFDDLLTAPADSPRWHIIDVERVGRVNRSGGSILESLVRALRERGIGVTACDPRMRGIVTGVDEYASMNEAL